jgi:hypothetical protein
MIAPLSLLSFQFFRVSKDFRYKFFRQQFDCPCRAFGALSHKDMKSRSNA